jgi:hypothetical protein
MKLAQLIIAALKPRSSWPRVAHPILANVLVSRPSTPFSSQDKMWMAGMNQHEAGYDGVEHRLHQHRMEAATADQA